MDKVRAESQALSADEMLLLGVELIDSAFLPNESEESVSSAWDAEILKRVEDVRSGTAKLVPWPQVLAGINSKYGWDQ